MIYTYDSSMLGAPVLSGTAGALRNLIKAALVDGFGAGAVATLTVASGIATATFAGAHPYRIGTVAQVGGATPSGLNGQKRVLSITSGAITFDATGIADGTATGTITHKVAAAGWQELFAGTVTNVLCIKPTVAEATGCVLRIDDTGTTNARVRAYEAMTSASTGVGPTPLDAQVSGGLYWPKSGSANATERPWQLIADDRGFFLSVAPQSGDRFTLLWAGDIASLKSGDAFGYALTGNQADQTALTTAPDGCCGFSHRNTRNGAYLVRAHTAIGQSIAARRTGSHHTGVTQDAYAGTAGYAWGTYPNGPNNGLMMAPLEIFDIGMRGTYPGMSHAVQDCGNAFVSGAVVSGTNDFMGRNLMVIRTAPPSGSVAAGTVLIDLTGPWSRA